MQHENLPNLIIAGVNKCGTTSLYSYLSAHNDVCPSSIKETCYFLPLRYGQPLSPIEDYTKLFKHWTGQKYLMEATPAYFCGGRDVAKAIHECLDNPRIVLLFRDPTERAFSFFRSLKGKTLLPPEITFHRYIETCQQPLSNSDQIDRRSNHLFWGIQDGFYINYLYDWYDYFGDSVRVLFFEHLKSHPLLFMQDLCNWLGIDHEAYTPDGFAIENRTAYYKHRSLHQAAISVNKFFEKQLRRHPEIKQTLRKAYFRINETSDRETMTEIERDYLNSLYLDHNRTLRASLMEKGYRQFPDWLKGE
jgi:hypothetical protein